MCCVWMFYNHDHKTAYMLSERTAQSLPLLFCRFFFLLSSSSFWFAVFWHHVWIPSTAETSVEQNENNAKTKSHNENNNSWMVRTTKRHLVAITKSKCEDEENIHVMVKSFYSFGIRYCSSLLLFRLIWLTFFFFCSFLIVFYFYHLNARSSKGENIEW